MYFHNDAGESVHQLVGLTRGAGLASKFLNYSALNSYMRRLCCGVDDFGCGVVDFILSAASVVVE